MDPLRGSAWSAPEMVGGFARSSPNQTLLAFAARERAAGACAAIDIGCGAGRNLIPLARQGWTIAGVDLSRPMIEAAAARVREDGIAHAALALAPMDALPFADACADLVIAHGIWNLARSAAEFRRAVREAARVARTGAALFVFTFSRRTIPADASPVAGETFVFTQFAGEPQCFLTDAQLVEEMRTAGFAPDPVMPLMEYNVPRPGALMQPRAPVIYEAVFRRARYVE
jgi:ubiquinone/menaquinone biosynthesis C-methylase UbiE